MLERERSIRALRGVERRVSPECYRMLQKGGLFFSCSLPFSVHLGRLTELEMKYYSVNRVFQQQLFDSGKQKAIDALLVCPSRTSLTLQNQESPPLRTLSTLTAYLHYTGQPRDVSKSSNLRPLERYPPRPTQSSIERVHFFSFDDDLGRNVQLEWETSEWGRSFALDVPYG